MLKAGSIARIVMCSIGIAVGAATSLRATSEVACPNYCPVWDWCDADFIQSYDECWYDCYIYMGVGQVMYTGYAYCDGA